MLPSSVACFLLSSSVACSVFLLQLLCHFFVLFETCASSLVKVVEVFLCGFEVQWAWYRFSGACIKIEFAKLPAFVAKSQGCGVFGRLLDCSGKKNLNLKSLILDL